MTAHAQKAGELFAAGYNCAQSVACAFWDITGLTEDQVRTLSAPFGGGMGRLREVCGALTGAYLVLGTVYGGYDPTDKDKKAAMYTLVQELTAEFKAQIGSIYCRDIQPSTDTSPIPEERTQAYYRIRPCRAYVELAAELLDTLLKARPEL